MWVRDLCFPPSTNNLFSGKARRFKSDKYKLFEKEMAYKLIPLRLKWPHEGPIALYLYFYRERSGKLGWFNKDGSIKEIDLSNRIKALEDCLFHHLGIDDRRVFELHCFKCVGRQRVDAFLSAGLITKPVVA